MHYLGMLLALIIAFYTFIFGLENLKTKNYMGFFALAILAAVTAGLPFYILFLR